MLTTLADNDRVNGWKRCHALLREAPDGMPWLLVHPDARYLIRTIPAARSSKTNADDVDTDGDDHALDSWRYGAMSPAYPLGQTVKKKPEPWTLGWFKQQADSRPRGVLAR